MKRPRVMGPSMPPPLPPKFSKTENDNTDNGDEEEQTTNFVEAEEDYVDWVPPSVKSNNNAAELARKLGY